MLFKFHTCTLNRVYGYVRVQLVANSFEPLYCTLSNVLYRVSVQCTVQCPMYCTVPNVLYSVLLLYNVQCTYSVWRRWLTWRTRKLSALRTWPSLYQVTTEEPEGYTTHPTPIMSLYLYYSICTSVYCMEGGGEEGNPPSSSPETPFPCLYNCFVGCILQ